MNELLMKIQDDFATIYNNSTKFDNISFVPYINIEGDSIGELGPKVNNLNYREKFESIPTEFNKYITMRDGAYIFMYYKLKNDELYANLSYLPSLQDESFTDETVNIEFMIKERIEKIHNIINTPTEVLTDKVLIFDENIQVCHSNQAFLGVLNRFGIDTSYLISDDLDEIYASGESIGEDEVVIDLDDIIDIINKNTKIIMRHITYKLIDFYVIKLLTDEYKLKLATEITNYLRFDFDKLGTKMHIHPISHLHTSLNKNALRIPVNEIPTPLSFLYFIQKYVYKKSDCFIDSVPIENVFSSYLEEDEIKRFTLKYGI